MFCLICPPLGWLENEYVRILLVNLTAKLEHYGIRDVVLQWIKSYFSFLAGSNLSKLIKLVP